MSVPTGRTPGQGIELPEDPEVAVEGVTSPEEYGPPEVVDPDREANLADQVEQTIEVPEEDVDPDDEELE